MKKTLLLIAIVLISCNHQKINIKKEFIERISKDNPTIASPYNTLLLFFKCTNDSLCSASIDVLHSTYHRFYSKSDTGFEQFISNALNQKIALNRKNIGRFSVHCFMMDKDIDNDYNNLSFLAFRNKHTLPNDVNVFLVNNKGLDENQLYSVMYYFFINNYKTYFDDYSGDFFVKNK